MTNRSTDAAIITDQQAEGSRESYERREPEHEPNREPQAAVPAAHPEARYRSPAAETGVVAAVVLPGEGQEDRDNHDASRTLAETQPLAEPQPKTGAPTSLSALIVEDTPELAEILQLTLRRMQIVTAHESHGKRAFDRFNAMQPDIVLLDIGLPDVPGWTVLENIKEQQRKVGGEMPIVIVITAYGDPANRLVGKLHDVDCYLIKPFTPHEVERVVRDALSSATG